MGVEYGNNYNIKVLHGTAAMNFVHYLALKNPSAFLRLRQLASHSYLGFENARRGFSMQGNLHRKLPPKSLLWFSIEEPSGFFKDGESGMGPTTPIVFHNKIEAI